MKGLLQRSVWPHTPAPICGFTLIFTAIALVAVMSDREKQALKFTAYALPIKPLPEERATLRETENIPSRSHNSLLYTISLQ